MKQMNDTQSDIDTKSSRNRLFPIATVCLSIMVSSTAMGQELTKAENDSIVRAMYGFMYQETTAPSEQTDGNEIIDLSRSNYGTADKPVYSNEAEYTNFLSNPIYLNRYFKTPSFSGTHTNLSNRCDIRC